ncbi:helix-turn-helix transcriptional regulator [Kocuria sabuli]|uniref:helix-turn-helix transcriptional regulator n=1 Tax=Kocuria sabuli TaxID=3071448 RepID=UPI0034D3BB0D
MSRPAPIHLHFSTTDPEVGNEALQQVYARARMGRVTDPATFRYSQDVQGDADLALGQMHFHGTVAGHLIQEQAFSVIAPIGGSVRWEIDDRRGTGHRLFLLQPGQHYYGESEHLSVDSANLGLPALEEIARTLYGDEHLRIGFTAPRPVSPAMAAHWKTTYQFVHESLTDPATAEIPLLRADLLRRMAVTTLEAFPLAGDPVARRVSVAARQAAYTQAVEFIHATLSLPITLEDVARHAGVSTIELTRAFRTHADTTPGAYLRGLHLAAAHAELRAADPGSGATVSAIAARWGFAHLGNFARHHRQAYGVNPAHTLRH